VRQDHAGDEYESRNAIQVTEGAFFVHLPRLHSNNIHSIEHGTVRLPWPSKANYIYRISTLDQRRRILHDARVALIEGIGKHANSHC